jgi:hypothetical protein
MSDKKLQLKTPLKNMLLNLRGGMNSATKAEQVHVSLGRYVKPYCFQRIVFTFDEIANCYLNVSDIDCSLWVSHAAFDIRPQDVELIATTFGIRVDRKNEGTPA